jgi:hypothetical protein
VILISMALAQETQFFTYTGELRLLSSMPPTLVVDTDGTEPGQDFVLDSRLRLGFALHPQGWNIRTEWDFLNGQLAGDTWDIAGSEDDRNREELGALSLDGIQARRLSVDGRVGPMLVEAGLMTSHWGLGMVANDGAHDPVFGRSDFGDRVIRVRATTKPWEQQPFFVVVAGDRVVEDELAEWGPVTGGQAAWQGILSLMWAEKSGAKAGLYGVYRHQLEEDGMRLTQAWVLDFYGTKPMVLGPWTLEPSIEAAGILGRTNRALSYNARDQLSVQSAGVAGQLKISRGVSWDLFRAGWASGDGNPDDGALHDFTFDRDFDVGMVLFDEVLGAVDAAAYAQVANLGNAGGAPPGSEGLVAEGAFRHAAFIQPVTGGQLWPWLKFSAGTLVAWNTAPIYQPFITTRNGGVPTNFLGEETQGYYLGTEVDWSVTFGDVPIWRGPTIPALVVQGGHAFLGDDLGGGVYSLLTATGRMRW